MKISLSHMNVQGINIAVFDAKPLNSSRQGLNTLLGQLTAKARFNGLRIEKSALAYSQFNNIHFWGDQDLVEYLSNGGFYELQWTHKIDA